MAVETRHLYLPNRQLMDNQAVGVEVPREIETSSSFSNSKSFKVSNHMKRSRDSGDGLISGLRHQEESQIDRLIAQHTERMRMEFWKSKQRLIQHIKDMAEGALICALKAKEEEIKQIEQVNTNLLEQAQRITIENQIWRNMAHTTQATAIALRANLDQALAQKETIAHKFNNGEDDNESCCDNYHNNVVDDKFIDQERCNNFDARRLLCRVCGKEETCVLLLPCRHLCLCSSCSTQVLLCPICSCTKQCTLHVNLS